MGFLLVLATLFWGSILSFSISRMAAAPSPPAAYAAAAIGAVAIFGFCLTLIIVWLTSAWLQPDCTGC
jgi:hypothetical protein